jgi:hypothetical protein
MNKMLRSPSSILVALSLALGGAVVACDANTASSELQTWRIDPNGIPVDDAGGEESGGSDGGGDGDGCTLTQGYWKNHAESWPLASDAEMCGSTMIETLQTPPKGNAWLILAHQYIAAALNVASGAEASADIAAALDQAEALLTDCTISDDEKADAIALSELLDQFNNGAVGPGHCDDGPGDTGGDTSGGDTTGGETGDDTTGGEDTDCGCTTLPIPQ